MEKYFTQIAASSVILVLLSLASCGEASLLQDSQEASINSPSSLTFIEGSDWALLVNSNVNLDSSQSFLVPYHIPTQEFKLELATQVPNFVGGISINEADQEIYLADRANDGLFLMTYEINGDQIQFETQPAKDPILELNHVARIDDEPSGVTEIVPCGDSNYVLVPSFIRGTLNYFNIDEKVTEDLNEKSDLYGLDLNSGYSADSRRNLGVGASSVVLDPDAKMAWVSSNRSSFIFVVDVCSKDIELVLDGQNFPGTGNSKLIVANSNTYYWAHGGSRTLIKASIEGKLQNGVSYETQLINADARVRLETAPLDIKLSPDESQIWVTLFDSNRLEIYATDDLRKLGTVVLSGRGPSGIFFDGSDFGLVPYFLSSEVSLVQISSFSEVEVLQ